MHQNYWPRKPRNLHSTPWLKKLLKKVADLLRNRSPNRSLTSRLFPSPYPCFANQRGMLRDCRPLLTWLKCQFQLHSTAASVAALVALFPRRHSVSPKGTLVAKPTTPCRHTNCQNTHWHQSGNGDQVSFWNTFKTRKLNITHVPWCTTSRKRELSSRWIQLWGLIRLNLFRLAY